MMNLSSRSSLFSPHLRSRAYAAVLAAAHDHKLLLNMFPFLMVTQSHHYSNSPSPPPPPAETPRTANSDNAYSGGIKKAGKQEVFWMRDPKTGNWIPETHLYRGDRLHDVADLRAKFLFNNPH